MKKEVLIFTVVFFLVASIFAFPTSEGEIANARIERKTGLSLNIGAPAFFGFALDYYVIPQINAGIAMAPFMSTMGIFTVGGGVNVLPWGGKQKAILQFTSEHIIPSAKLKRSIKTIPSAIWSICQLAWLILANRELPFRLMEGN